MMEAVCFYLFAGLMILAALSVVCSRRPIYSVLSLLAAMFCLAALFVMLQAYFLAALQVLLYAGAVLVLFLFVMMLLNLEPGALTRMRLFTLGSFGTAAAVVLFLLLLRILTPAATRTVQPHAPALSGGVEAIGRALFSDYLLPFELTSFLILAAIIGAVTLARQEFRR